MDEYLHRLRHSSSHILADAVLELYPGTKLGMGPAIENGFYYDFDSPFTFNEDNFSEIENKMKQIIEKDIPFIKKELRRNGFFATGACIVENLFDHLRTATVAELECHRGVND